MLVFFNDTATTEIYTLSLHDALPICGTRRREADTGGSMSSRATGAARSAPVRRRVLAGAAMAVAAAFALPAGAFAAEGPTLTETVAGVNTTWVIVAAILVMFMQAGFALLEIGFSRMKNAGAGIAKILINFSISSIAYWA